MQNAAFKTLVAVIIGSATWLTLPAQAQQPPVVPQAPVEYVPGYYGGGIVEADPFVDPFATGSVVILSGPIGLSPGETWIGYCSRRYPTYDRTSNTWWGPDGRQYLCR